MKWFESGFGTRVKCDLILGQLIKKVFSEELIIEQGPEGSEEVGLGMSKFERSILLTEETPV